jgi:hypothetical protein
MKAEVKAKAFSHWPAADHFNPARDKVWVGLILFSNHSFVACDLQNLKGVGDP